MKDFQSFYDELPGIFLRESHQDYFTPKLSAIIPDEGRFSGAIRLDEMVSLIDHPLINWVTLKPHPRGGFMQNPLMAIMQKMSIDLAIPIEPELAEAFGRRFGAEGTIALMRQGALVCDGSVGGHSCHGVLSIRCALIVSQIEGALDRLVDEHFSSIKNSLWLQEDRKSLVRHPDLTPAYFALGDEIKGISFSLHSVLSILSAIEPEKVSSSIARYLPGISPVELVALSCEMPGSANARHIENGMLYIFNRVENDAIFYEFIEHAMPKLESGDVNYVHPCVSRELLSALIINRLRKGLAAPLIKASHEHASPEEWSYIVDSLVLDQADEHSFDVVQAIRDLGDDSPLMIELKAPQQYASASRLRAYFEHKSSDGYVSAGDAAVMKHLWEFNPGSNEQALLRKSLKRSIPLKGKIDAEHALSALRLFAQHTDVTDIFKEIVTPDHNLVQRLLKGHEGDWNQKQAKIKLIKELIALSLFSKAEVYSCINTLDVLRKFEMDDPKSIAEILPYASNKLKRQLVTQDMAL